MDHNVARFTLYKPHADLYQTIDGEFVRWEDYDRLRMMLQDVVRYAGDTGWNPDGVADAARTMLARASDSAEEEQ